MTDVETAPVLLDPVLADALMVDLLFARRLSERMWNLQRQGRLTTVAPLAGQEAAVVGVVRGLDLATDWLVPYYRDATGYGALGDEFVEQLVVYWRGHPDGGRIPDGVRALPVQISLATQLPHAAGLAWGLALRGDPGVVCTFLGDGATSEGDFYEAINLAGVQRAPLIVVCMNNGWAISTPVERQTAAETFAAKGAAAGIPGVRVDGNDVVAVLEATREARAVAPLAVTDPPCSSSSPTGWVPTPTPTIRRATSPPTNWPTGARATPSSGSRTSCGAPGRGTTNARKPRRPRSRSGSSASSNAARARGRSRRRPRSRRRAPECTVAGAAGRDRRAQRDEHAHRAHAVALR